MSTDILLVDDRIGDIKWLISYLERRRYNVDHVTDEEAARAKLEAVAGGQMSYALAIIDIMVSVKDIMDLVELDEGFYEQSRDTGIRLCQYAREELGIGGEILPIVCISARDDYEQVKEKVTSFDEVQIFRRTTEEPEQSLRYYLDENLLEAPATES